MISAHRGLCFREDPLGALPVPLGSDSECVCVCVCVCDQEGKLTPGGEADVVSTCAGVCV